MMIHTISVDGERHALTSVNCAVDDFAVVVLLRRGAMKARRLIDGASFGPETVTAMGKAFDLAWREIAGNYGEGAEAEPARLSLAEAMLSVATEGSTEVEVLKRGALQAMALDYRSGIRPTASAAD
jgi:hypothetical protein